VTEPSRRRRGAGAVYQRQSDGRWVGVVDLGWIDGRRRRRTVYGQTEDEVLDKLADLWRLQAQGVDLSARSRTVGEWLREWLRDVKGGQAVSPTTWDRYRHAIEDHLIPSLGKIKLEMLRPRDIQQMLARRHSRMSAASLVKVHAVLRNALEDAVRLELVSRNAAKAVRPPKLEAGHRPVLTPEGARALLAEFVRERMGAAFALMLVMGLRRSEVLALRWSDLDLDERRLRVSRSLVRAAGALHLRPTKTYRSARSLPLPALVVPLLEQRREQQTKDQVKAAEAWQDSGLIFTTMIGTPVEPRNLDREWDAVRKRVGLSWVRLHDLRHAYATFLLAEGIEPRTVMELMGHSTLRLTMELYGHALPERMHEAAKMLDELLDRE
jgi:integrase